MIKINCSARDIRQRASAAASTFDRGVLTHEAEKTNELENLAFLTGPQLPAEGLAYKRLSAKPRPATKGLCLTALAKKANQV